MDEPDIDKRINLYIAKKLKVINDYGTILLVLNLILAIIITYQSIILNNHYSILHVGLPLSLTTLLYLTYHYLKINILFKYLNKCAKKL